MKTLIDLFSGAGGLSTGLCKAGFEPLFASEVHNVYAETYKINHPSSQVRIEDIRDIDPSEIRTQLELDKGEIDLIAGGPPCQGFSINAPIRSQSDSRNSLFLEFLRFVHEFEPKAVLIENVPGLVSFSGGETLHSILIAMRSLGYEADVKILYAPHYGVPQTRWRTLIVGLRPEYGNPLDAFPEPVYKAPVRVNFTSNFQGRNIVNLPKKAVISSFVSVKDAIDDLPKLKNGEVGEPLKFYRSRPKNEYQRAMRQGANAVSSHEAPRLGSINIKRLKHIPPGGNWTNIPRHLLPSGMKKAHLSDHTKRYGRVNPDGLASTILTKCDPHWGAYFHYEQDRCFTVREAARIQSFPDTYTFIGSRGEQYEQVGNAVPPLLAQAIGERLNEVLSPAAEQNKMLG